MAHSTRGVLARCRYELSYPLRAKAGLNCPLTGNGMCIGRDLLAISGWQAFSLTENWELYASYTAAGIRIHYAQDALLYSLEVSSLKQGYSPRRRWLAGRLLVAHKWVAQLAGSRSISLHQKFGYYCRAYGIAARASLVDSNACWYSGTIRHTGPIWRNNRNPCNNFSRITCSAGCHINRTSS